MNGVFKMSKIYKQLGAIDNATLNGLGLTPDSEIPAGSNGLKVKAKSLYKLVEMGIIHLYFAQKGDVTFLVWIRKIEENKYEIIKTESHSI